MIRLNLYLSDKEKELLEEVDAEAKKIYVSRSGFTKLAWRMYLNWIKRRKE